MVSLVNSFIDSVMTQLSDKMQSHYIAYILFSPDRDLNQAIF